MRFSKLIQTAAFRRLSKLTGVGIQELCETLAARSIILAKKMGMASRPVVVGNASQSD
jgi:hypothetical protein